MKTNRQSTANPTTAARLSWNRLPNESKQAHRKFLVYLGKCSAIACKLARHNMPLNLEILPQTEAIEFEMFCTAYRWRERVPSFFRHLGATLQKRLAADAAESQGPVPRRRREPARRRPSPR